jgi:hypothetical protein
MDRALGRTLVAALRRLEELHGAKIGDLRIQYALMDVLDLPTPAELYAAPLSEEYIVQLLIRYDFARTPIPPGAFLSAERAERGPFAPELLVKQDGRIYSVHKNDVDPRPSKPHAHDDCGRKVDLSNGDIYTDNKVSDRLSKKKLKELRHSLRDRKQDWLVLPPMDRRE